MERNFKGVWIPAEVWLNAGLSLAEKVMLVEIDSLQHPERGCYASNAHFAKFFGLSNSRVSEIITSLASKGIVSVELVREGKRVVERRVRMVEVFEKPNTYSENAANPIRETEEGYSEKAQGSNTSLSNTEKALVPAAAATPDAAEKIPYEQIRELYNQILGGKLPRCLGLNDKHRKHIRAAYNLKLEGKYIVREGGMEFWEGLFHDVLDCDFLLGQNGRAWQADFAFLTTATKIQAFFEGKYDAR